MIHFLRWYFPGHTGFFRFGLLWSLAPLICTGLHKWQKMWLEGMELSHSRLAPPASDKKTSSHKTTPKGSVSQSASARPTFCSVCLLGQWTSLFLHATVHQTHPESSRAQTEPSLLPALLSGAKDTEPACLSNICISWRFHGIRLCKSHTRVQRGGKVALRCNHQMQMT